MKAGRLPIAGKGESVLSFTHAADAASAIVAALENTDVAGVLNIVDDAPITIGVWPPGFAAMLGAPDPGTYQPQWSGSPPGAGERRS